MLKAKQAKKSKVVDALADPHQLEHAAVTVANGLVSGAIKVSREMRGVRGGCGVLVVCCCRIM